VALPAALASRAWRRAAGAAVALVLAAVALLAFLPASPLFQRLTGDRFVSYKVAGDTLWLPLRATDFLVWAADAVGSHVPPGAPILLAPNMPGLYPFFGRLSPVWNVYPIWPSEGRLDQRMLGELKSKDVQWALLQNASVDGEFDLRFRNTHPEVWDYLMTEFETAEVWKPGHPRRGLLLRRKGAVDVATPPAP
jgi:hypothetical protein